MRILSGVSIPLVLACQLACIPCFWWATVAAGEAIYQIDDGSMESMVGFGDSLAYADNNIVWLNQFSVQPGGQVINEVTVVLDQGGNESDLNFAGISLGDSLSVVIWNDSNGDGHPADASVLSITNATVQGSVMVVPVVPTPVSGSFFVGASFTAGYWPAGIDETDPDLSQRSYLAANPTSQVDLNDLGGAQVSAWVEDVGYSGNWALRAHGVPEPSTVLLLVLGGSCLLLHAWRRRRNFPSSRNPG